MNKAEVVDKVSEISGESKETCEKVLRALQKVLQQELGAKGVLGAMGKVKELLGLLSAKN